MKTALLFFAFALVIAAPVMYMPKVSVANNKAAVEVMCGDLCKKK